MLLLQTKDEVQQLGNEKEHKEQVNKQQENNLDFMSRMHKSLQNDQATVEGDKREQEDKLTTSNY